MKKTFALGIVIAAVFSTLPLFAQSAMDDVRVEVRSKIAKEFDKIKNSTSSKTSQDVSISIVLFGRPKTPETRVVKWALFGKGIDNDRITILASDTVKLALDYKGQQTLESTQASVTYTPDHTVSKRARKKTTLKQEEGSGVKYFGYGVVVVDGAAVVGKAFTVPSLEAEMK